MFTRNTDPEGRVIVSAAGTTLKDDHGNHILDFCAQTLNLSLGHCNPIVNGALEEAMESFTFLSSRFVNRYTLELAQELAAAVPVDCAET